MRKDAKRVALKVVAYLAPAASRDATKCDEWVGSTVELRAVQKVGKKVTNK